MNIKFFSLLSAFVLTTQADFVDFSTDTPGQYSGGWQSNDSANVSFRDSDGGNVNGGDIYIGNFTPQSVGIGLAGFGSGYLVMDFSQDYTSLSFLFGNDDPDFFDSNGWAQLSLYNNDSFVAMVSVQVNANDDADQTMSYSGAAFDEARFVYLDSALQEVELAEVIDNLSFEGNAPVPEAHQYATLLGGMFLGAEMLRRRRAK